MGHVTRILEVALLVHFFRSLNAPNQCDFGTILTNKKWNTCQCRSTDNFGSLAMICRNKPWLVIPPFKADPSDFGPNDQIFNFDPRSKTAHVTELAIVDSNLVYLSEDSFKYQTLEKLDLSRNQIEKINVNAFKGLENRLVFLSLDSNRVSKLPIRATSILNELQYFQLRHNVIDRVESGLFEGSQLKNLRVLHLDHNLIDEIPEKVFSTLPLHVLTMENNRIRLIHSTSLPKGLRHLNLKGNSLAAIPYDAVAESADFLESLDLEGNGISTLPVKSDLRFRKNLTINLANNRISRLDSDVFSCFGSISHLDLSHNQINFIHRDAFRHVKHLEHLDLSYNKLSSLPDDIFSGTTFSLKRLSLEENNFHVIPIALGPLNTLEYLNMKSNKLFKLDKTPFYKFGRSLKHLQLSYNLLIRIPFHIMRDLSELDTLDLSKNDIEHLDSDIVLPHDSVCRNLVHLNLAGNRIKYVWSPEPFSVAPNLITLDLSNNRIESVSPDAFKSLVKVENLFLQRNLLETYTDSAFKKLTRLRRLILDYNRITALPVGALSQMKYLEHLILSNNRIQAIIAKSFNNDDLKALKTLNFASNYISFLAPQTFTNLPSLQTINLQGNLLPYLSTYSFYNLTNLISINLSGNRLARTFQLAFFDLPRLEYVVLSSNHLDKIETGTFSDVPRLEHINLRKNKFFRFESQYLYRLKHLKYLDLSSNSLNYFELDSLKNSVQYLNLNRNQLRTIDEQIFVGYENLRHLLLADNSITDVHYKALFTMKKLINIDLSQNRLTSVRKLTFSQQENIERLSLSRNLIRKLDSSSFGKNNVQELDLNDNRLDSVPHSALDNVKLSLGNLNLADNFVMSLESDFFEGLKNLSSLSLRGNRIQRIEEASFKGMQNLRNLDLSNNPIIDWHPNAFKDLSGSIEHINLAKTGLASLPAISQRTLKYLNVSYNTLYAIGEEDVQQMTKLENFDLSYNRISLLSKAALRPLVSLKRLNVSRNPISFIDADHFSSLRNLESLSFSDLPNLIRFDVRSLRSLKNLKELSFYGFPELYDQFNLTTLLHDLPPLRSLQIEIRDRVLKHQFSQIDTRFLRNVRVSGTRRMKTIAPDAFQKLQGHELKLSLQNTGIKHMSSRMFETISRVTFLDIDLRNNELEAVNLFQSHEVPVLNSRGTILADIRLDNNPLTCDCRLSWTNKWFAYLEKSLTGRELEKKISRWNRTTCFEPESLKDKPVLLVDFASMGCFNSQSNRCTSRLTAFSVVFVIYGLISS